MQVSRGAPSGESRCLALSFQKCPRPARQSSRDSMHPARVGLLRALRRSVVVCALAVLPGSGCRVATQETTSHEPVEECKQYETALNACFHRDAAFAAQPALLPASESDRTRIAELCAENLRRIRIACR